MGPPALNRAVVHLFLSRTISALVLLAHLVITVRLTTTSVRHNRVKTVQPVLKEQTLTRVRACRVSVVCCAKRTTMNAHHHPARMAPHVWSLRRALDLK